MSKVATINNFARGLADDRFGARSAEFAHSKHFDILTYPRRLQPLRGMSTESVTDSKIGNIIVGINGLMFGVGTNPADTANGQLWRRQGYGGSDVWAALSTNQLSGAAVNYDLLVDWADAGNVRTVHWASANLLVASDPAGGSSATTQALTFASIGQGYVHPKDKVLYFPYKTTSAQYIGKITANATPFSGLSATALTLPSQYRAYCLSHYGNYLAIPQTTPNGANINSSIVYLWDRDTTLATVSESITWGEGSLQVLNNLGGVLIGISSLSANFNNSFQDYDSIVIKGYIGGDEPFLIKEIKAQHLAGSSNPTCTINPRVNFIRNNRLYFSINVNPGDGVQSARYGLWSVGKNKVTGEWTVVQERVATNANTETGVIAAAITGDFVSMVHTAVGTLTYTSNGQTSSSTYGATSVYESVINPEMPLDDLHRKKLLDAISVNFEPLPTSATVVLKYRVDSKGDDDDWVTVRTFTTAAEVRFELTNAGGETFKKGVNYEFRIESTGGAVITSFSYRYQPDTSSNV